MQGKDPSKNPPFSLFTNNQGDPSKTGSNPPSSAQIFSGLFSPHGTTPANKQKDKEKQKQQSKDPISGLFGSKSASSASNPFGVPSSNFQSVFGSKQTLPPPSGSKSTTPDLFGMFGKNTPATGGLFGKKQQDKKQQLVKQTQKKQVQKDTKQSTGLFPLFGNPDKGAQKKQFSGLFTNNPKNQEINQTQEPRKQQKAQQANEKKEGQDKKQSRPIFGALTSGAASSPFGNFGKKQQQKASTGHNVFGKEAFNVSANTLFNNPTKDSKDPRLQLKNPASEPKDEGKQKETQKQKESNPSVEKDKNSNPFGGTGFIFNANKKTDQKQKKQQAPSNPFNILNTNNPNTNTNPSPNNLFNMPSKQQQKRNPFAPSEPAPKAEPPKKNLTQSPFSLVNNPNNVFTNNSKNTQKATPSALFRQTPSITIGLFQNNNNTNSAKNNEAGQSVNVQNKNENKQASDSNLQNQGQGSNSGSSNSGTSQGFTLFANNQSISPENITQQVPVNTSAPQSMIPSSSSSSEKIPPGFLPTANANQPKNSIPIDLKSSTNLQIFSKPLKPPSAVPPKPTMRPISAFKQVQQPKQSRKQTQKSTPSEIPPIQSPQYFPLSKLSVLLQSPIAPASIPKIIASLHKYFSISLSNFLNPLPSSSISSPLSTLSPGQPLSLPLQPPSIMYNPINFTSNPSILPDQGINKFINDVMTYLAYVLCLNVGSYRPYGDMFYQYIRDKGYEAVITIQNGYKINAEYVTSTGMYIPTNNSNSIQINVTNPIIITLLQQFIAHVSTQLSHLLKKLHPHLCSSSPLSQISADSNSVFQSPSASNLGQQKPLGKPLLRTNLPQFLLTTAIFYSIHVPPVQLEPVVLVVRAFYERLYKGLSNIVGAVVNKYTTNSDNPQSIVTMFNRNQIIQLIPIVNQIPDSDITKMFRRILLLLFGFDQSKWKNFKNVKDKNQFDKDLIKAVQNTKSPLFMPFRVILHRFDKSFQQIDPYNKDLFQQIDGPEWMDWLSLYLGEDNLHLSQPQLNALISSLPKLQSNQLFAPQSQLNRLIHIMRQQSQIKNFYFCLSSLINSQQSIKKVQQQFFTQDRPLLDDLRLMADQISKFPNCETLYVDDNHNNGYAYYEKEIGELKGRAIYFLKTVAISPQRVFQYQNGLFDIEGFYDVLSERCDRVCHLVLDLLAYFSLRNVFQQDIVVKCFEAIIALLQTNSTKQTMSLCMNINRPQFDFLNKNLPKKIIQKIYFFLAHLLSNSEFYQSTRITSQNQRLQKAYPLRYNTRKYLQIIGIENPLIEQQREKQNNKKWQTGQKAVLSPLPVSTQKLQAGIPIYWFSNCLKLTSRQQYNPQLLFMMLSRLKIYASKAQPNLAEDPNSYQYKIMTEVPFTLSAIVDACNNANFWRDFNTVLASGIETNFGGIGAFSKLNLYNLFLAEQTDKNSLLTVFYTLKLLKIMLQLRKIRNNAQKQSPRHFISQLLSNLHCLNQLDRKYLNSQSLSLSLPQKSTPLSLASSASLKANSPLLNLLALVPEFGSKPINTSSVIRTQWLYSHQDINVQNVRKIHMRNRNTIDYAVIRDILVHPNDHHLEYYENIGGLALQCIHGIMSQSQQISIQSTLYLSIPKSSVSLPIPAPLVPQTLPALLNPTNPHLPSASTSNPSPNSIPSSFYSLRNQLHGYIENCLRSNIGSVSRAAWKLLILLRKTAANRRFAQDVFRIYCQNGYKMGNIGDNWGNINYLVQDGNYTYSDIILQILQHLPTKPQSTTFLSPSPRSQLENSQLPSVQQLLPVYFKKSLSLNTLPQLQRLFLQKQLIQLVDYYQMLGLLAGIVVMELYSGTNQDNGVGGAAGGRYVRGTATIAARKHCASFVHIIAYTGLLYTITNHPFQNTNNSKDKDKDAFICDDSIPRLYGQDILQIFISNPQTSRQSLLPLQLQNIKAYITHWLSHFVQVLHNFLSIILSIDITFYGNHPLSLTQSSSTYLSPISNFNSYLHTYSGRNSSISTSTSQLFCQLHLGVVGHRAVDLFGSDQKDAFNNVRGLLQASLDGLEKIKYMGNSINAQGILAINYNQIQTTGIIKCYGLIDLLLNWLRSQGENRKLQVSLCCKKVLLSCFPKQSQPIIQPISAKLLLTCTKILCNELSSDLLSSIKQTITKTLSSACHPDIPQYLLSLLVLLPIDSNETFFFQYLGKNWCFEEKDQYFYSESRVLYTLLSQKDRAIQFAKAKILSKCSRIARLQQIGLVGVRYQGGIRTWQCKTWTWILKIATVMMQYGKQSTLVVNQLSTFLNRTKKRILYTLNQARNSITTANTSTSTSTSIGIGSSSRRQSPLHLNLAQLDQLQATLELFIVLSQCKIWIQMNREYFQQMFYVLVHRTIVMFDSGSLGYRIKRKYVEQSSNETIMSKITIPQQTSNNLQYFQQSGLGQSNPNLNINLNINPNLNLNPSTQTQHNSQSIDEQNYYNIELFDRGSSSRRPNIFRFLMSVRYNQCLKLWMLACSNGMRSSCFVRQYFTKSITSTTAPIIPTALPQSGTPKPLNSLSLKYSLTHWQSFSQSLCSILQNLSQKLATLSSISTNYQNLLPLLNSCVQSAQFFIETGYLYTVIDLPKDQVQYFSQLGHVLGFGLEMGACHLVSLIGFKARNQGFARQGEQALQEKLWKLGLIVQEKIRKNVTKYNDYDEKSDVLQHIAAAKDMLMDVRT